MAVAAALLLALVVVAALASGWVANRLEQDFWPVDASRVGPNILASVVQWSVLAIVAVAVYPPLRRWVEGLFRSVHEKLDAHHTESNAQRDLLHEKLDHVIRHHPDIPEFEGGPL